MSCSPLLLDVDELQRGNGIMMVSVWSLSSSLSIVCCVLFSSSSSCQQAAAHHWHYEGCQCVPFTLLPCFCLSLLSPVFLFCITLTGCSLPTASSSSSCWQAVRHAAAVVCLIDDRSHENHLSNTRNHTCDVNLHIMYMYTSTNPLTDSKVQVSNKVI